MTTPVLILLTVGLALPTAQCFAAAAVSPGKLPPGAAVVGYTKCVIDERPSVADIAPGKTGHFKWFNGLWYQPPAPSDKFRMVDGVLAVHPRGVLVSAPHDFSDTGRLPTLPGKDGFYVEFDVRLSDNNPDHWPAVWLMPIEQNGKNGDHYEGDPDGYLRYMELDVDEGGMGPGMSGAVHSWAGNFRKLERHRLNPNHLVFTPLDRAKLHTFGASYEPAKTTVTWWLDGVKQMSATKPYCPDIAAKQHFYLIMNANYHYKKDLDYQMFISGVRAYVPPTSSLPAVPAARLGSGGSAPAADAIDLRGYGRVQASITPQRSEFTCDSDAKANILLGKLLADMFWDAGQDRVAKTVRIGERDVVVHEWPPYGAVIAGRLKNHVLVIGAKDEQDAVSLAAKEPLLMSAGALFTPVKPYPKYFDFYDLGAVKCYTLDLHPENKFRARDRAAFTKQFFAGGLHGFCMFDRSEPAEGVNSCLSLLDTDVLLAKKNDQMYSVGVGTGVCPEWVRNKWPDSVDRSSPIHNVNANPYLEAPPEAFGLSGQQRRQTSLGFLHDIVERYKDSPSLGGWQLYCGDYTYETYFAKSIHGHYGYTPAGREGFRRWLRGVRGLGLADVGKRWYGEAGHFKDWSEVTPPDPDEFFGDLSAGCLPIRDSWFWKKSDAAQIERPADDAPGWTRVPMPPSEQMLALPPGPSFWRAAFDAGDWLGKNARKEVYLVFNVENEGWRKTNVWLNDVSLGEFQSKACPYFGPFALKITRLLQAGANTLCFQVAGGGNPVGPVFLTTILPRAYPYLGKLRNAQYVDAMEWRLHELNSKEVDAMAYARSIDPDRPFVVCATGSEMVKDAQGEALRRYGGSMQDTGYEASFRPFNPRLGYAGGFYGSCEQAGIGDIMKDPAAYATVMTRRLGWLLFNGEGSYMEWRDPYCYFNFENKTGWFTKNKRTYRMLGKYLPEKPEIAILHSSLSTLLGSEFHGADWDLGRGELHANHYDNVYVMEGMLALGLADDYPVLFDTDTMMMDRPTIDAIRRYVERGGTFVAMQNSGRHSLLDADAWPISQLTGFKVLSLDKKGKIRFGKNLPLFRGWEGKEFAGEGSALDWKDTQSAKDVSVAMASAASDTVALARWEDGSVAVGMRKLGKGRVIVLGSTFWRYGQDLGGKGMWRASSVEPVFLERLLTDLGVRRTADASTPDVYARKVITKNGLEEWLIALNTTSRDMKADVGFAVSEKPDAVWDVNDHASVPFTYADGWVRIKGAALAPWGTRVFGARRGTLSEGIDFWWGEKAKFWTRSFIVPPLVETAAKPTRNPPAISFTTWKFLPDRDGAAANAADWRKPSFNDAAWRKGDNTPWNLQFDDLKDYGGVGLYRSLPFSLPAGWNGKTLTLNMDGLLRYCWTTFDLYLNGQKIDEIIHPRLKVDVTGKLKKTGNVVCIKLTGRPTGGDYPLSGLLGCAVWIQPEITLSPSMSLLGEWQAVRGDWSTARMVSIAGAPLRLTDDCWLKKGIAPVKANHLVRDVTIPSAWKGRSVYLRLVTPHMHGQTPPVTGLSGGMVIVNGKATFLDQRPNVPLDEMLNVTPDIKFGETNRIELWTRGTSRGSMAEDNIVVNEMAIGCAAE